MFISCKCASAVSGHSTLSIRCGGALSDHSPNFSLTKCRWIRNPCFHRCRKSMISGLTVTTWGQRGRATPKLPYPSFYYKNRTIYYKCWEEEKNFHNFWHLRLWNLHKLSKEWVGEEGRYPPLRPLLQKGDTPVLMCPWTGGFPFCPHGYDLWKTHLYKWIFSESIALIFFFRLCEHSSITFHWRW